jgi:hypothetical protein
MNRTIVISTRDKDAEAMRRLITDLSSLSAGPCPYDKMKVSAFSELLTALPELKADALMIITPWDVNGHLNKLEAGLKQFREHNPGSAVVISNLCKCGSEQYDRVNGFKGNAADAVFEGFISLDKMLDKCDQLMARV